MAIACTCMYSGSPKGYTYAYIYMYMCQGEIMLQPVDEGQNPPETAVQGLHLLSFGTAKSLDFFMYMYMCTCIYTHVPLKKGHLSNEDTSPRSPS